MNKATSKPQDYELRYGRGEVLTDEEYAKLMKQKELEELHSLNDDEHIRSTSERQVNTYIFFAGVFVGGLVVFWGLELIGAIK